MIIFISFFCCNHWCKTNKIHQTNTNTQETVNSNSDHILRPVDYVNYFHAIKDSKLPTYEEAMKSAQTTV